MRLLVTTPMGVVVDSAGVTALRAEDASGSFGILDGHADFLTVLAFSILRWRGGDGEHFCAVRQGVLRAKDGRNVTVATRQAVLGDDLQHLETAVLAQFRAQAETEQVDRADAIRREMAAIQHIIRYLRPPAPGLAGSDS